MSGLIMLFLIIGIIYVAFNYLKGPGNSETSRNSYDMRPYGDDNARNNFTPPELPCDDETEMEQDGEDMEVIGFEPEYGDDMQEAEEGYPDDAQEAGIDPGNRRFADHGNAEDAKKEKTGYTGFSQWENPSCREYVQEAGTAGASAPEAQEQGNPETSARKAPLQDNSDASAHETPAQYNPDASAQGTPEQVIPDVFVQDTTADISAASFGYDGGQGVVIDTEVHIDAQMPPNND